MRARFDGVGEDGKGRGMCEVGVIEMDGFTFGALGGVLELGAGIWMGLDWIGTVVRESGRKGGGGRLENTCLTGLCGEVSSPGGA